MWLVNDSFTQPCGYGSSSSVTSSHRPRCLSVVVMYPCSYWHLVTLAPRWFWYGLATVFQDHLASARLALGSSMALGIWGVCKSIDGGIYILNIDSCRVIITIYRVSSFVWKVEWSPQYRPPMIIGICSLLVAISLAFGKDDHLFQVWQYALRFKKKKSFALCWSEKIDEWIMRTRF